MCHPTPLIVTDKNQSMLTVEGPNSKVTRNSSHFKRFLTGEPIISFFDTLKESSTDVDMVTRSLVFCTYFVSEVCRPWAYWPYRLCWDLNWRRASKVYPIAQAYEETYSRDLIRYCWIFTLIMSIAVEHFWFQTCLNRRDLRTFLNKKTQYSVTFSRFSLYLRALFIFCLSIVIDVLSTILCTNSLAKGKEQYIVVWHKRHITSCILI